ncbi:hypothetical protein [Bradyrhizobium sp. TM102]|uniref:hypothetical protein n=1 Tax=Bradyrhizobium sp. TM102 TaxID=2599819 RepID=UPI001260C0A9|nr:hypothetical protein [Bradyrhizobium sp. TM102]BBO09235.1 hypothetical protein TM102_07050 [Bradyrhizobium sp. TM102]
MIKRFGLPIVALQFAAFSSSTDALSKDIAPPPATRQAVTPLASDTVKKGEDRTLGEILSGSQVKVTREDYPLEGVALGQGWDRYLNRKQAGTCVTGSIYKLSGHSVDMQLKRVEDKEHVFDWLKVSASAKFSGGLTSVEGSSSFSREVTLDTSNLNLLAIVNVDKGGQFLGPVASSNASLVSYGELKLTDEAQKLLKTAGGLTAFQQLCGDAFVIGVREGGALNALLKLKTFSREEKRELDVEIKAKGLWGSASASMNQKFQSKVDNNQFEFQYNQLGGNPDEVPTDAPALVKKLKDFAKREGFEPRPYEIYLIDYRNLKDYPSGTTQRPATPEDLNIWSSHYWRLINLYNEYQGIVSNPDFYSFVSFGDLKQSKTPIDDALDTQDTIVLSAKFLDIVLGQCALNRNCELQSALAKTLDQIKSIPRSSPLLTEAEAAIVRARPLDSLIQRTFGATAIAEILNSPDAGLIGDEVISPEYKEATKAMAASAALKDSDAKALSDKLSSDGQILQKKIQDGSIGRNGFDWYYYWLGLKPVFRGGKLPGSANNVEPELNLGSLVTVEESNAHPKDSGGPNDDYIVGLAADRYRTWIFQYRFSPLSSSFCSISATHPMCMTSERLKSIAGQIPLRVSADFVRPAAPPPPPPAPTPPPRKEPREPREPRCNPRICW